VRAAPDHDCGFANFRAFCLLNLGVIDFKLADLKSAGAHLERALEQARSASGPVMLAAILQNLGRVAVRCGDLETARGHLCEGLLLASAARAAGQELNGVAYFAELLARTGDRVRAATYFEFVVTHPATEAAIRDEARESLATLAPTPAESAIAETEARQLELGTLVDTLIKWSAPLNDAHSLGARAVRPHQVA
jgi:tetratricopeptide (TPR) repeat protein